MLVLFKGELSYEDFMYKMPYKSALELKNTRVKRLLKEQEATNRERDRMQSENIRNRIMAK